MTSYRIYVSFVIGITVFLFSGLLLISRAQSCTTKSSGDADCNGKIDLIDYEQWRREYIKLAATTSANFNTDTVVNLIDYEIWRRGYANGGGTPPITQTSTTPPAGSSTPPAGSTTPPPSNLSYDANLQMILASPHRNKANDGSPYLNTPSVELFNKADLYGSRSDYDAHPDDKVHNAVYFTTEGDFRTMCEFSHFAYDDPIVFPNKPGAAHLHMFFGNTYMNAYSGQDPNNNDVLNKGGSTCNGDELNRTGYWAPAIIDGKTGEVRVPSKILVYYKLFAGYVGDGIVYPERMRFVIDKDVLHAAHQARGADQLAFKCNDEFNGNRSNYSEFPIPNCQSNGRQLGSGISTLEVDVLLQDCWNGQDVTDYKNNVALLSHPCKYDSTPPLHTRQMPNLEYKIIYPIFPGEDTSQWFLSSDVDPMTYNLKGPTGETNHADWWSGWNAEVNKIWVDNCNNKVADCAVGWLDANASKVLKVREQYEGPYKIPAQQLYDSICKIPKTMAKPADIAYCDTTAMKAMMMEEIMNH